MCVGGPLYSLIDVGKLSPLKESLEIGHVIRGKQKGRVRQDERIIFIACGMAVFDLAWGMEAYNNAADKNIGQKLLLWDAPY